MKRAMSQRFTHEHDYLGEFHLTNKIKIINR